LNQEANTKQQGSLDWTVNQANVDIKLPAVSQNATGRNLPAPRPISRPRLDGRRWLRIASALALILLGATVGAYWWKQHQAQLLHSIVWSNGRIDSDEIDIDTKYAGRIAEMRAEEGDMVKAGQVVARMDTRDLEASLKKSEARVRQVVYEHNHLPRVTDKEMRVCLSVIIGIWKSLSSLFERSCCCILLLVYEDV
jgi:hypothetical protein